MIVGPGRRGRLSRLIGTEPVQEAAEPGRVPVQDVDREQRAQGHVGRDRVRDQDHRAEQELRGLAHCLGVVRVLGSPGSTFPAPRVG